MISERTLHLEIGTGCLVEKLSTDRKIAHRITNICFDQNLEESIKRYTA